MKAKLIIPLLCIFSLIFSTNGIGATETTTTGVASPQSDGEANNIEVLRQRALRNAMDMAIMQITGATISGEKGNSYRTREKTSSVYSQRAQNKIITDTSKTKQTSEVQNRYSSGAVTRTEGHAKLIEIIKEWQDGDQYYLKAKFSVETQEEAIAKRDAGYFWKKAGSPGIALSYTRKHNGESEKVENSTTLRFFRDNLVRNNIEVSSSKNPSFLIDIQQVLDSKEMTDFGTTTMNCRLTFRIIDKKNNSTVEEYRKSNGPEAGFNLEMAEEKCISEIARDGAENLVRKIARIMNERVQNGLEHRLVINGLPGELVTIVGEISQNLFRVTSSTSPQYSHNRFTRTIHFKGSGAELAQSLSEAFADEDWGIAVVQVGNGQVHLNWLGTKN